MGKGCHADAPPYVKPTAHLPEMLRLFFFLPEP